MAAKREIVRTFNETYLIIKPFCAKFPSTYFVVIKTSNKIIKVFFLSHY
jgi:hypothetical protein